MVNEMHDLLDILTKCEESGIALPKYVAYSYDGMPPTSGFEVIANSIVSLVDENTQLKEEIKYLKEERLNENTRYQDTALIKEDVLIIKGELQKLNHKLLRNELRRDSLLLQSVDDSFSNGLDKTAAGSRRGEKFIECEPNHDSKVLSDESKDEVDTILSAPSFAEVMWIARKDNSNEESHGSFNSFSPSVPPLMQELAAVGGVAGEVSVNQDVVFAGSYSPSAPPLSQDIPGTEDDVLGREKLDVDSDGFMLVQKKQKKFNPTVVGSKKNPQTAIVKGAKRFEDLYIGNCDLQVTVESLSLYISKEMGVKVQKCEALETRSTVSKSFKVSLNINDRQKLLNPDIWPEDIICRKFYNPRQNRA